MRNVLSVLALVFALTACSSIKSESAGAPKGADLERKESFGRITGEDGVVLGGGPKKEESGGIGVNSFLWRATLDTISFMPLASADPFGGVIITDWYEDPQAPGTRFKVNALIIDKSLRSDGIKITVFRQNSERGNWRDQKVDNALARKLEDTILTRARELKVAQGK